MGEMTNEDRHKRLLRRSPSAPACSRRSSGAVADACRHQGDRRQPRPQRGRSHQRPAPQARGDAGLHRHQARHDRARCQRRRRLHDRAARPLDRADGQGLRPEPAAPRDARADAGRPRRQRQSLGHAQRRRAAAAGRSAASLAGGARRPRRASSRPPTSPPRRSSRWCSRSRIRCRPSWPTASSIS